MVTFNLMCRRRGEFRCFFAYGTLNLKPFLNATKLRFVNRCLLINGSAVWGEYKTSAVMVLSAERQHLIALAEANG